jgi:hypothetical protein
MRARAGRGLAGRGLFRRRFLVRGFVICRFVRRRSFGLGFACHLYGDRAGQLPGRGEEAGADADQ